MERNKQDLADLRQQIADYLEMHMNGDIAYMAANAILKMCQKAGLRKFAPAEETERR